MSFVDTHCHLDGEEFRDDLEAVVARAREAGVGAIGIPGIDLASCDTVLEICSKYPDFCYPMLGLHPEEVKADWQTVLEQIKPRLSDSRVIAIGEVGLDFYWSREFEQEQLAAFEEQVKWSVELQLPLMIHCRKAQHEMVAILKRYQHDLPGGVFHCFTGNEQEARELLQFDRFVLGIGGVLTFKKSHLPELPFHADTSLERVKYVAEVNKLKKTFENVSFEDKDNWEDPIWGIPGDRIEKVYDPTRDATLTIHYFDSEDGVCRTAFASVSNQIHECRQHSIENAWKFISQFRKEN